MGNKNKAMPYVIAVLAVILVALIIVAAVMSRGGFGTPDAEPTTQPATEAPTPAPTPEPTEPPIVKESTATIGVTGDILFHDKVIESGLQADGTYNYDHIHRQWKSYVQSVDFAVANLEVTLCGSDNGYSYKGYPCFNSPDAAAEALKNACFDMVLTANNHSYDTGNVGFLRTQHTLDQIGLKRIGTRMTADTPNFTVEEINGIQVGMINYTYATDISDSGKVYLNGIGLSAEDSNLVNAFSYARLEAFYNKLAGELEQMKQQGAEVTVLYIHWGDEYQTTQNETQSKMAQRLCDLGIDVIVGNHAHVPQPVELLTNSADETKKTLCIYSTGNAVSNIYKTTKFPKNTEDGMLFSFTFAKYSDGTVLLESADVLPTWVDRTDETTWEPMFLVLPLDREVADWQGTMGLSDATLQECKDSYDRTMGIVGPGLEAANGYYAEHQRQVEAALGVED